MQRAKQFHPVLWGSHHMGRLGQGSWWEGKQIYRGRRKGNFLEGKDFFFNVKNYSCKILRNIEQNTIIGEKLLYDIVLAFATHQPKSVTGIHVSSLLKPIPSPTPSHPSMLSCVELLVLHMVIMCFYASVWIRPTLFLPLLCLQICSLCLHLPCCPANRFISTIFLDSICMH